MEHFNLYTKESVSNFISTRKGETKFGQKIQFIPSFEALEHSEAEFVIFGIPEDIGVRANHGKPGTASAWEAFLSSFLNLQANQYNDPENCVLLGEIPCKELMKKAASISLKNANYHKKLGDLVSELDEMVSKTVCRIVSSGKTPIIIGGGHNNAYGNIKGTSVAMKKAINVLNIDAHTDLRNTDFRHSGNGFSYTMSEGFLKNYAVFGLHKNYTPNAVFNQMDISKNNYYELFEDLLPLSSENKVLRLQKSIDFLEANFGLEIDCDAMANFPSSAITPSGFSVDELRNFINILKKQRPHYLHICEASAKESPLVGKALAYFVSDFIRKED